MSTFFPRSFRKQYPVASQAQGVWITDNTGKRYLDGCSGAVVSNLGHGLSEIIEAVIQQAQKLAYAHTSQFFSEPALALTDRLIELVPEGLQQGGKVFLTSGGSEAIETAIKLARSYYLETGELDRQVVISRWHGYHGATLGALSATGHPARRKPYLPILKKPALIRTDYKYRCACGHGPGPCTNEQCDLERADELEKAIVEHGPERVMAFIGEPIIGATLGAAVPGPQYWKRIREICTRYDVLLIADEVMTGLGRCGAHFAMQLWDVEPDLIVLGKGLAAGYQPLGAVVIRDRIVKAIQENSGSFMHGYTYSGHPVAAAAGLASLNYLEEHELVDRVCQREQEFFKRFDRLKDLPFVGDIRGRGFLAGIEVVRDKESKQPFDGHLKMAREIERLAAEEGLLVYPGSGFIDGSNGDQVVVAPPFIATDEELDELFELLERALKRLADELAARSDARALPSR